MCSVAVILVRAPISDQMHTGLLGLYLEVELLSHWLCMLGHWVTDFPGGSKVKASACNVGDPGSIPGLGRSHGEGNGNPLQYSYLQNQWMEEPGKLSPWNRKELNMAE